MRGQSRTEIAQKEPAHGHQWNREGHPCATPREQAQVKSEDRRAKTECQNREEWGHHVPNRRVMEKWKEDRARTSQPAVHCRVEEEALVEQGLRWGAAHNVSSGPVKDDGSRRGTLRTRDCGQSRDAWADGWMGDHSIRRSSKRGPQLWAQQRGRNGRRMWHAVRDTERIGRGRVGMEMLKCSKEAVRRGSDRGTRSCVQKGQWSPQAWTDRANQS